MSIYGDPDAYQRDQKVTITRPDGSTFIQNDPSTYTRVELEPVERPEELSQRWSGVSR